jgi:outer membrane protein
MKINGWMVAGGLLLALVFAVSPVAAAEKIGFVNIQEIILGSTEGKKAAEEIKKNVEKAKATIEEKEKELQKMKEDLEKQRPLLKEDVVKEKETDFQKKYMEYKNLGMGLEDKFKTESRDLEQKMLNEVVKIIRTIGEKEKYTMIVDYNALPYHAKESDLTKRVLDEFNKTYKPGK